MSRAVALCLLLTPAVYAAEITYIGEASLPGTTRDLSGLTGRASDGTPNDRLGGLGSAIDYTGKDSRYVLVADRGPADGAVPFYCRFHAMDVVVDPAAKTPVTMKLVSTTLFTDETGERLSGSLKAKNRFDPEGARVGPKGTLFVSDEYGPAVAEFDMSGKRLRTFDVPKKFAPLKPSPKPADELPPKNTRGRQPNRGMEGLAITPDGKTLVGAMQSPLIQDGALDKKGGRVGVNTRLLAIDVATGKTREFVYRLESPANGVNEILALDATRFLVLERDGLGGLEARAKRLYLIDMSKATDVSDVEALPTGKLPGEIVPVTKELYFDLLDPKWGLKGKGFPEKIEGIAFGPTLPDGRRVLIVTADNDFVADRPFRVFAFGVKE